MKRHWPLLAIALASLFLFGCVTPGPAPTPTPSATPTPTPSALPTASATPTPSAPEWHGPWPSPRVINMNEVVITLSRTPCAGLCPDYSLVILGDGNVTYRGMRFVNTSGVRAYSIPQEKVRALIEEFYKINYMSLKDRYESQATGLSSTTTSITIEGTTKSVYDYYGAPSELKSLENKIDETANVTQWISGTWQHSPYPLEERECCSLCLGYGKNESAVSCVDVLRANGLNASAECESILVNTPAKCLDIATNPEAK